MSLHNGYRARWNDTEYEASPDGQLVRLYTGAAEAGFEMVAPGRFRKLVLVAELDWFGYVRSAARHHGTAVVIAEVRDGHALVDYADGAASRWVKEAELTDRVEQRLRAG
jgi:protein required for attachment to host cells